jgi:hypothetical protein
MRARLLTLLAKVQGGGDEVLLLKSATLRELLLEMKEIVMPAGQFAEGKVPVICEENKGRAGFKLSVPESAVGGGTAVTPYEMLSVPSVLNADTWDVTAPPGGTDGVIWHGPRFNYEVGADDTTTDSASDTTDWTLREQILVSRSLTFSSTGQLVAISAEFEVTDGSFSFR